MAEKFSGILSEEEIYELFKEFKYIIPQGSVMAGLNTKKYMSLSNCMVIPSPHDSYSGILFADEQLANLYKRRCGVGTDISTLRPMGTSVTNAAKESTGAVSFMHRYSNTTREAAQNGRRGALMLTISVNHPDVEQFAIIKRDLTQVTGANISIQITDEFMLAVEKDEDFILRFPVDADINLDSGVKEEDLSYDKLTKGALGSYKKIKAKKLWDIIISTARDTAEPGLIFKDAHDRYCPSHIYPGFENLTTNPCGEIMMGGYDSCRLMVVNLFSFVEDGEINYEKLYDVCYKNQILADKLVDLEVKKIDNIISKIKFNDPEPDHIKEREIALWTKIKETALAGRRTGCGITGLGDMLAYCNVQYGSPESLKIVEKVFKTKMKAELAATIDLAEKYGPFPRWNKAIEEIEAERYGTFFNFVKEEFPDEWKRMQKYGRRNISWSTVAPTGTVSLMTQTTSGIEPLFTPYYIRRKKINPSEGGRVDFVDQNGDSWQEYPVLHPQFKKWINSNWDKLGMSGFEDIDQLSENELDKYFKKSPYYNSTAEEIDWIQRVEMQAIIQKYTTHSISSTINLPEDISVDKVKEIYMESWKRNLKGITIYRDGSRTGVLVKSKFPQHEAPSRPKNLLADCHTVSVKGEKFRVIVGLMDNKPYEIFAYPTNDKLSESGEVVKVKSGVYEFHYNDDKSLIITDTMSDVQVALCRSISTSLRHGTPVQYVVEQQEKSNGDITSFSKAIARVLKKYIPVDKLLSRASCKDCGSTNIKYEEGCLTCLDCGSSKC